MGNWLVTLRAYRDGVTDVIGRLEQALPDAPAEGCCCQTKK